MLTLGHSLEDVRALPVHYKEAIWEMFRAGLIGFAANDRLSFALDSFHANFLAALDKNAGNRARHSLRNHFRMLKMFGRDSDEELAE